MWKKSRTAENMGAKNTSLFTFGSTSLSFNSVLKNISICMFLTSMFDFYEKCRRLLMLDYFFTILVYVQLLTLTDTYIRRNFRGKRSIHFTRKRNCFYGA